MEQKTHTVVDNHKRFMSNQFVDSLTALAMRNNNSSVKSLVFIVGNPNRKKMHIFGFVGIFEYICKTTFNIILSMCTKP